MAPESSVVTGKTRIDPVTASVIQGAMENIAVEMGHKLMRMSYSSIIRESEDFGAALTDAKGRQLCETPQSTPLQSGPIPGYIEGILQIFGERGDSFAPGDVIIHNSAYHGASHVPDIAFCVPMFVAGNLVGFSVTTAHHLDIGALSPGSCGIVDAMDAYAEGLQMKALKIIDGGTPNQPLWQMLRDNIRASDLVVGDMEAQIAAARIGAKRFLELVERYSLATVEAAYEDLMDYSERIMRAAIADLPDGRYTARTTIDGYEDSDDPARRDLPIVVTAIVEGDTMTVDFAGTAPQVDDRPINMPFKGTTDCAVWLTIRSILLDTEVHGHIPQNSGLTRPIKIVAPTSSLVNPTFPAPTIARFCSGNQAADTLMKALGQAVPRQISAGVGNLHVVAFSGIRDTTHWVHMEIHEGCYGGRFGKDGLDAVDTLYANTRNNPIEDIESHLPLRVNRYELRDDACAPGQWRGGIGSIREFEFTEDGGLSIEGEGHVYAPWGFDGGTEGRTSKLIFEPGHGDTELLPSKVPNKAAKAGDKIVLVGPCGGGYGDPLKRNSGQVMEDIRDGYVSVARARAEYGVVVTSSLELDETATEELRREQRV
ncbi:MAG: hydantoinase B/oxoprolinase family protein [Alphaproteobacteria bacterium]